MRASDKVKRTKLLTKNQYDALQQKLRRQQVFPGREDTVWYTIEVVRAYWEAPCLLKKPKRKRKSCGSK